MRATILILLSLFAATRADTLNLANGDRYLGAIQLVNESEIHLKSETLGLIKIPRAKVASIFFGTNQPARLISTVNPEATPKTATPQFDEEALEKVQQDFLATATPEANAMFTDLVKGLSSGKLSIEDIRKQARDALKELRELQAEVGDGSDDDGDNPLLAGYIGILEKFINSGPASTKSPKPKSPPRPVTPDEE